MTFLYLKSSTNNSFSKEADVAQVMSIRHLGDCQAKAGQEITFNTIAIKRDQDTPT